MKQILNIYTAQKVVCLLLLILCSQFSFSQKVIQPLNPADTTTVVTKIVVNKIDSTQDKKIDSVVKKHSPRIAARRSAMLPGWGQIYNKKYWKLPIVYGALGTTAYIFFDNIKTYREYRFAYNARYLASLPVPKRDSTDYRKLKDVYKIYSPETIRAARNKFRQYVDYSVIFFLVFWGLNVVDATVDAHLKAFDVSPNLSLSIKPGRSELAGTNGISLVLNIGKK
jgi:Family of unknown function (DUF5683)